MTHNENETDAIAATKGPLIVTVAPVERVWPFALRRGYCRTLSMEHTERMKGKLTVPKPQL